MILQGSTEFNYYRHAYCDGAYAGLASLATAVGVALLVTVSF